RLGTSWSVRSALLVLSWGTLTGCGGAAGPLIGSVTGQVTFESKPVASGQISFSNDKEGRLYQAEIKDGAYKFASQYGAGIPAGPYKVQITPLGPPADPAAALSPTEKPKPAPDASDIPKKYRDAKTSGLTAEVKAGSNPLNFDMKPE